MWRWTIPLACAAISGCYLSHEAGAFDAPVHDAPPDAPRSDTPAHVVTPGVLSAPRIFPRLLLRDDVLLIAAGAGFTGAAPAPIDVYDLASDAVRTDPSAVSGPVGAAYFLHPDTGALMSAGGLGFDAALGPSGPASDAVNRLDDGRVEGLGLLAEAAGWPLVTALEGNPIVLGGLHHLGDPTAEVDYTESRRFYLLDGERMVPSGNVNRGVARGRAYDLGNEAVVTGGIPDEAGAGHANVGWIRFGPGRVLRRTGAQRMDSPRVGHAGVVDAEGRVVAIGGLAGGDSYVTAAPLASVEADRIDEAARRWVQLPDLPVPLALADAVLLPRGAIVVVGGTSAPLERAVGSAAVFVLEPGADRWTRVAALDEGRYAHGVALLPDGSILVAGGLRAPGDPVLEVERIVVP